MRMSCIMIRLMGNKINSYNQLNVTRGCMAILVAVLVCFSQPTIAQNVRDDPRGSYGKNNCGTWHQVRQALPHEKHLLDRKSDLEGWVLGFLTGLNLNAAAKNVLFGDNPGVQTVWLWVDKYCRENPLGDILNATFKLWDTLPDIRLMIPK